MVHAAFVLLRSTVSELVGVLLATLLLLVTPVGTGQGVHASVLLHPVLPHVHLLNGQFVTDEQLAAAQAAASAETAQRSPSGGPVLGAGSGAVAAGLGIALGPTLPQALVPIVSVDADRLSVGEILPPTEFRDPPQEPPPNPHA
jgi:hypothetical protein